MDKNQLLREFSSIAKCTTIIAEKVLRKHDWKLQPALDDYLQSPDIYQDGKKQNNEVYTGGESSGMMVQLPDKPNDLNVVRDIVQKAHERLPESDDEDAHPVVSRNFTGQGHKLEGGQSSSNEGPSSHQEKEELETVSKVLTFWKNGFTVDDGELMDYNDPKNQELLNAIKEGHAPIHLLGVKRNQPVELRIAHNMERDFVPQKKPLKAFHGQGQRLGGIVPTAIISSSPMPTIDPSKPVTQVQIRMMDGSRLVAKLNKTHTVDDLYSFVKHSVSKGPEFILQTNMPVKVLSDKTQTLESAGLLNAVVLQRPAS